MNALPTLDIAAPDLARPDIPKEDNPEVEVWHDHHGRLCAVGHLLAGAYWVHVLGLASYRFTADAPQVVAVPYLDATLDAVSDRFHRSIVPLALQVRGWNVLHASAVETPIGLLCLCAHSNTGKSTLAYALSRRGYPLWADDAVLFQVGIQGALASPLPFRLRLRPASAAHFDTAPRSLPDARSWAAHAPKEALPVAALCVLERLPRQPARASVQIVKLRPASAYLAAIRHLHLFSVEDPLLKRAVMTQQLQFSARVPVYQVRFRSGLAHLPDILRTLEQCVRATVACG